MNKIKNNGLVKKHFFKKISYSTCWEDFNTINSGLKIKKDDVVFSITSAGDNTLNALLHNPKKVISVDFNPNQNYLLKLKITSIKKLDYKEFLELIGIIPSKRRMQLYRSIRKELNDETRQFWDKNQKIIKKGITYNGKQERYIQLVGRYLRGIFGENKSLELLTCNSIEEQRTFFKNHIKGFIWNAFFNIVYSKPVMLVAKDKLVFNQVKENNYSKKFKSRTEYAIKNVGIMGNPFASIALIGSYLDERYYPDYLKKENFKILKKNIDRIKIETGDVFSILKKQKSNSIDKFNLSNVLDWVSLKDFQEALNELTRVSKPNGRFCYYNTLMKRYIPNNIKNIKPNKTLSKKLLRNDRSFLYKNFQFGIIKK